MCPLRKIHCCGIIKKEDRILNSNAAEYPLNRPEKKFDAVITATREHVSNVDNVEDFFIAVLRTSTVT